MAQQIARRNRLREDLESALASIARAVGTPLKLSAEGRCGLRIGGFRQDIVIEWIEPVACVAVHAAAPPELTRDPPHRLAATLMLLQVGGVATRGCALWLLPDHGLRVALTLVGPTLDDAQLLEAIGRVARACEELEGRIEAGLRGTARAGR